MVNLHNFMHTFILVAPAMGMIQDPGSRILDPGSWIQDPGSRILDPGGDPKCKLLFSGCVTFWRTSWAQTRKHFQAFDLTLTLYTIILDAWK